MRSIGSVNIRVKLGQFKQAPKGTTANGVTDILANDYTCFVMTAEDYILEISRSGVKDVSSMVL
jgi:hypothetical protein